MFQTLAQPKTSILSRPSTVVASAQRTTVQNATKARKPRLSFSVILLRALSAFAV